MSNDDNEKLYSILQKLRNDHSQLNVLLARQQVKHECWEQRLDRSTTRLDQQQSQIDEIRKELNTQGKAVAEYNVEVQWNKRFILGAAGAISAVITSILAVFLGGDK